jgi:hypothetical protein
VAQCPAPLVISPKLMDRAPETTPYIKPPVGKRRMSCVGNLQVSLTFVAVLTLLLGGLLATWAHVDPPRAIPLSSHTHHDVAISDPWLLFAQPISPALPEALLTFTLFGLMALAMARSRRRWQRGVALGQALVLGAFTFGVAIHGVHHLSEPQKAAECQVFSASQHVAGAPTDTCDLYLLAFAVVGPSVVRLDTPTLTLHVHPAQPRAPPSFHA